MTDITMSHQLPVILETSSNRYVLKKALLEKVHWNLDYHPAQTQSSIQNAEYCQRVYNLAKQHMMYFMSEEPSHVRVRTIRNEEEVCVSVLSQDHHILYDVWVNPLRMIVIEVKTID
jgi:hypothetical protein